MADTDDTLGGASQSLDDFASAATASAAGIESAVSRSFTAVSNTIAQAAQSGRNSMDQLTTAILADFDRIAASQFIAKPVASLVSSVADSLLPSVSGARATGGPVAGGESYLVGENGPELFTPAGNGAVTSNAALPAGRAQVTVNIATQDVGSFMKSRSQVAAMLAKAVAQGNRNL